MRRKKNYVAASLRVLQFTRGARHFANPHAALGECGVFSGGGCNSLACARLAVATVKENYAAASLRVLQFTRACCARNGGSDLQLPLYNYNSLARAARGVVPQYNTDHKSSQVIIIVLKW